MDTKGVGFVAILVVLGIVLGLVGFAPTLEHNVAVQESERTSGVVESTDIAVKEDDDGDRSYDPIVTYTYTVAGENYRSDNTYPGRFTRWKSSESDAQAVVDAHQQGEEVTVYYDPSNPSTAYLIESGPPASWLFGAGYAAFAAVGGVGLMVTGFRRWKQRQLMVDTPTATVQSLSIGPAEITGTALTDGQTPLSAPFSDEECLVAKYEVEEYDEDDDDTGGSWQTVAEGTEFMPFEVDDGTGTVRVEPREDAIYDLEPADWEETYVDSSDAGPPPIQDFVRRNDELDFPSSAAGKENDRKYRQNLIVPDESVYVYGTARPRAETGDAAGNGDRLRVTTAADSAVEETMFLLSDDSETDLIDRREWALWRVPVGAFFVLVAVCFALGMFGPEFGVTLPDLR